MCAAEVANLSAFACDATDIIGGEGSVIQLCSFISDFRLRVAITNPCISSTTETEFYDHCFNFLEQ